MDAIVQSYHITSVLNILNCLKLSYRINASTYSLLSHTYTVQVYVNNTWFDVNEVICNSTE